MEALGALSVTAAAVQFLQFSLQALQTCREIRDDWRCASRRNSELEEATKCLHALATDLQSTTQHTVPKKIAELASKCSKSAEDLTKLLKDVRGAGKSPGKARAFFRVIKNQKTIEKLEQSLTQKQASLDRMLQHDHWFRSRAMEVKQCEEFDILKKDVKDLVGQFLKLQCVARSDVVSVRQDIASLRSDIRTLLCNSSKATQWSLIDDKSQAQKTQRIERGKIAKEEETRRRQAFVDSLRFGEINARRCNITDAARGTLDWIYSKDEAKYAKQSELRQWMEYATCPYWICGKAGSGKSTLVAHLVEDERSQKHLQIWAQERRLHRLSFFFWRPGTETQRSIVGLIRTLLYQVCSFVEESLTAVLAEISAHDHSWTLRSLRSALFTALTAATDRCFTIFIDGLDEHTGKHDELLDTVVRLQEMANVKCCLSSRPEVELARDLQGCQYLRLEQLNFKDISCFIENRLRDQRLAEETKSQMGRTIAHQSEGVFLWASLVTSSLVTGIRASDDEEILWMRIRTAPTELNDLFQQMLERLDMFHLKSLVFYLHCLEDQSRTDFSTNKGNKDGYQSWLQTMSVVSAARSNRDIDSRESFVEYCAQTQRQVTSHSAGLLEVVDAGGHGDSSKQYGSPLETKQLTWIHRSAYDFIFNSDTPWLLLGRRYDMSDFNCRILTGAAKYLKAFYPVHEDWRLTYEIAWTTVNAIGKRSQSLPECFWAVLDDLEDFFDEPGTNQHMRNYSRDEGYDYCLPKSLFWTLVLKGRLWKYMRSRIVPLLEAFAADPILPSYLIYLWFQDEVEDDDATQVATASLQFIADNFSFEYHVPGFNACVRTYAWNSQTNASALSLVLSRSCDEAEPERADEALREYVDSLLVLAHTLHQWARKEENSEGGRLKCVDLLENAIPSQCVYFGIGSNFPILCLVSARMFRKLHSCHKSTVGLTLYELLKQDSTHFLTDVRICIRTRKWRMSGTCGVCYELDDTLSFTPRPTTVSCLMNAIRLEPDRQQITSVDLVERCCEMIKDDIKSNELRLDATQQLFGLAFLRKALREWKDMIALGEMYGSIRETTADETFIQKSGQRRRRKNHGKLSHQQRLRS